MLSQIEEAFLARSRIARLATADRDGAPHVVPVCFVIAGQTLYIAIDEKPKSRPASQLKRLKNIAENAQTAVVVDHYSEDWSQLGWVMLRGKAEILADGVEHTSAQEILKTRYPQLRAMNIASQPVIALRIDRVTSWGKLDVPD